jgi:poly(3-hydroxybutyrate) depolymerase
MSLTRRHLLAALALWCAQAFAAEPLPAFAADASAVTVSGVSSGGYLAVQFQVAHSGVAKGVGAIAAGPYYCAHGSVWTAYYNCMQPAAWAPLPPAGTLKNQAESLARAGRIDPVANLAAARVWLFSGANDRTVLPEVVLELKRFYEAAGVLPDNLAYISGKPAGHGMVTENAGSSCDATTPPYINDCDYDAAGELLRFLLGTLNSPSDRPQGRLMKFDQNPFASGDAYAISMADEGYAYVPKACEAGRCRVHVAFHGCRQGAEEVGERFVREAGYNRWADANRLILLYPQALARYGWSFGGWSFVMNPRGCWDWWGYTGSDYHTKSGPQIRAVRSMLERLSQSPR